MKRLFLLLVFAFASVSFGQELPIPGDVDNAISGTVNFEGTVIAGVTDLLTTVTPSIMPFGWTLLGVFGVYALLQTLLQSTLRQMSMHHYQPLATVVAYVAILFRITVASTMMTFYAIPIPGVGLNFHQLFPRLGQALSSAIATDLIREVFGHFNDAIHFFPPVGMFSVLPAVIFVLVLLFISLAQIGMTLITAGSLAIVGVLTLCGPLMIPFYVLPGQDKRFWKWFDAMFSYSMYGFVGLAFIFVFCHSYMNFFGSLHSWSQGQWVWSFIYLATITVPFLWTMFQVPAVTHILFGGIGGAAEGFANTVQGLVVRGISGLIF